MTTHPPTPGGPPRAPWISLALGAALAAGLAALVPRGSPWPVWAATFVGGWLPVFAYLSLGDPFWVPRVREARPGPAAVAIPAAVLAAAGACLFLAGAPFEPAKWALWVAALAGAGALFWVGRASHRPRVSDALAVLLVWIPIELALLPSLSVPPAGRASLNVAKVSTVPFFVAELLLVRHWTGLGLDLRVRRGMLVPVILAFAIFAAVAIPAAVATGFALPSRALPPPIEMAGRALAVFALVALPEEILFRGVMQNGLTRALGSQAGGLIAASIVFGAAHLNNPPNAVEYAALATLAGVAYGWTYMRTESVVASALVHAAVDWVWSVFFGGAH